MWWNGYCIDCDLQQVDEHEEKHGREEEGAGDSPGHGTDATTEAGPQQETA